MTGHVTDLLEAIARLARVDIDDLDAAVPAIEAALVAAEARGEERARHAAQSETAPSRSVVGRSQKEPTGSSRTLSPARVRYREVASRMVSAALTVSGGASAVGRRLGLRGGDMVERWADPSRDAAITLGDVLAAGPLFASVVLGAATAHIADDAVDTLAALPIEQQVAAISIEVARLMVHDTEARADGHLSREELRVYAALLRAAQQKCTALDRKVLSALAQSK